MTKQRRFCSSRLHQMYPARKKKKEKVLMNQQMRCLANVMSEEQAGGRWAEDNSSVESHKQIAFVLNTALPPPSDNKQPTPNPQLPPPPASPTLLLHCALISQHFESFSHCIFYHFFLKTRAQLRLSSF